MKDIVKNRRLTTVILTVLLSGGSMAAHHFVSGDMLFYTEFFPLFLIAILCGYVPAIIGVVLTTIFRVVTDPMSTYVMTVYLLAVLAVSTVTEKKLFKSLPKSLLFGVVIAFLTGPLQILVLRITQTGQLGMDLGLNMFKAFLFAVPESEAAMIMAYLLYRYLPDNIKLLFPNGIFYVNEEKQRETWIDDIIRDMSSRLSFRVTRVIAVEAMMITILAAFVSIHLISITDTDIITTVANDRREDREKEAGETAVAGETEGSGEIAVAGETEGSGETAVAGVTAGTDHTDNESTKDMTAPSGEGGPQPAEEGTQQRSAGTLPKPREETGTGPRDDAMLQLKDGTVVGFNFGSVSELRDNMENAIDLGEHVFNDDRGFNPFRDVRELDHRIIFAFSFRLIMILFSAAIIISAAATAYLQFTVARPIREMSRTMKNFAYSNKDGSIKGVEELSRIKVKSHDEIKDLHMALVKTIEDMENYLERLREEDRIKNELEVAKASSDAKSAFLSSMSHEIRTPINAVLGFDEMILLENKDSEIGRYAGDIQRAGKTLLALVNDILDFSKIEAGKMEIIPTMYELTSTINDAVTMTMSQANDKGLFFDVNVDPNTPHLLKGDEIRIKQCMTNILSNAVKYTEKGGITLSVGFEEIPGTREYMMLNISIRDTGIGIKKEDMEKLFSAFDRLDQVRNKAVKGTGLGMSITKQLLEAMGSELKVESEYEKGSVFSFSVKQEVVKWEEIGDLSEAFRKYVPQEGSTNKNDDFYVPTANILVTDDTENNLLVVTRLLKRTGIQIDTADSGAKTLELVKSKKYDIIYLDHMMPDMDGIETLHAMEKLEDNKNSDTPVVVLTANAVSGSREMYMNEGFTDYMTKPVSYDSLKKSLKKFLPEEKIEKKPLENEGAETREAADKQESFVPALREIEGIDLSEGIKNSGDEETLVDVIKRYDMSIDDDSDRIERELLDRKMKDYTVHVHALKSSSRLIGAGELSAMALELENLGNEYQKLEAAGETKRAGEILGEIEEKTVPALELYRSYKEKLRPVTGAGERGGADMSEKPEISKDELTEMLEGIREFAEAFDMDTVDSV
nr:response regulator [Lachnospiraceae bacterium]